MSGRPAARLGDPTAHGGTLVGPGVATVLIGKMPAATAGDQHACPMATPGTPPIPHLGGAIAQGSTGVFIGGRPAARVGDSALCVGPPSSIVAGCPSVLVGESGSSSPDRALFPAVRASTAPGTRTQSIRPIAAGAPSASPERSLEIEVHLRDKAGRPLVGTAYSLTESGKHHAIGATDSEGIGRHGPCSDPVPFQVRILALGEPTWSTRPVRPGVGQEISAPTDAPEGDLGEFRIQLVQDDGSRIPVARVSASVSRGRLRASWILSRDRWDRLKADHPGARIEGAEAIASVGRELSASAIARFKSDP